MDFDVQRCTRQCAATGRELAPGEAFYSVLVPAGAKVIRQDYSTAAWAGAPENAFGWWKSQIPLLETKKVQWAPNDAMLNLFDELGDLSENADLRYVLALLLIRRRVLRLEDTETDPLAGETLLVSCPRHSTDYKVPVVPPDNHRAQEIQNMLAQLLVRDAA